MGMATKFVYDPNVISAVVTSLTKLDQHDRFVRSTYVQGYGRVVRRP